MIFIFCPIFRFKEAKAKIVNIDGVTFTGLKFIIDSIYKPESEITADNIEDVLPAAHLLQVNHLVNECKTWMKVNVNEENCFTFLELGLKYGSHLDAKFFILNNFVKVSEADAFDKISKESLIDCITSQLLNTNVQEFAVFNAAKKWILANDIPSKCVVEIMSHVRFALIPPEIICKEIATESMIDGNKECRKMVSDATMYHTNVYTQPFYEGDLNEPRGLPSLFIMQNGHRGVGYNTTSSKVMIHFQSPQSLLEKRSSASLDIQIAHSSLKSVQVNNFVYIFGTNCQGYQNFAKRYDPSTDNWIELAAVPTHATVGSSVFRMEKKIYFLGGMEVGKSTRFSINPKVITGTVCVYDILENKWSVCKDIYATLVYAAVAPGEGKFFLSGGYNNQSETRKRFQVYKLAEKSWNDLADMNYARCKHVLETVDDKIYAIGGEVVGSHLQSAIEEYDQEANQWTTMLTNGYQSCLSTAVVCDSKIYLIGGSEWEDRVHYYDPEAKKVTRHHRRIPSSCACNASAYITAPKK